MAQEDFLTMVDVDVRRQITPDVSIANIISKMVIPSVRFMTVSRTAGAGVMAVDHVMPRLQAIEPALSIFGFNEAFLPGVRDRWIFAAGVRSRKTNQIKPVRCVIEGTIVEWVPDEADPSAFNGCNSQIKEVTHFELHIDGKEWWYVDEDEREMRRSGVDLMAARRTALGA